MLADVPTMRFARARAGATWHLVNRAGASLCGEPGPWAEYRDAAQAVPAADRCRTCAERTYWLHEACPVPPHADRSAYSRWLQVEWWLAGGLVFRQEGR